MTCEVFEHTADLGLRIRAPNLESLFAEAARGLFSVIVANLDTVQPVVEVPIEIVGEERDYLLFDWLSELLYLYETQHVLLSHFDIQLSENRLMAKARGEKIDLARHKLEHEVKAITYHGLKLEQETSGWLAEVIIDI